MRKIIKTTTITLAVALAISPVMASNAEAQHDETELETKDYLIAAGIGFFGTLLIISITRGVPFNIDEQKNETIEFKPTVNFDSETGSLSYGIRYTIPLK